MISVTDARGKRFEWEEPPSRVVSLVPSTTETLYRLGVWDNVVGITRYCVHPTSATTEKVVVGGTKQCNFEKLQNLGPDLVICNQEENTPEIVHTIESLGIKVYVAFPTTHEEALHELEVLGLVFNKTSVTNRWLKLFHQRMPLENDSSFTYAYLIWKKPWMGVGERTFIHQQLAVIGGQNAFSDDAERYMTLENQDLMKPDLNILLSSEPFPFSEKHITELVELGIPRHRIHLIDGEYCSWHGVRMIDSIEYLHHWKRTQLS